MKLFARDIDDEDLLEAMFHLLTSHAIAQTGDLQWAHEHHSRAEEHPDIRAVMEEDGLGDKPLYHHILVLSIYDEDLLDDLRDLLRDHLN